MGTDERSWVGLQVEDGEDDPLDAFMAAEVMPEVAAKETEEAQKREEQRQERAQAMAVNPALALCCAK